MRTLQTSTVFVGALLGLTIALEDPFISELAKHEAKLARFQTINGLDSNYNTDNSPFEGCGVCQGYTQELCQSALQEIVDSFAERTQVAFYEAYTFQSCSEGSSKCAASMKSSFVGMPKSDMKKVLGEFCSDLESGSIKAQAVLSIASSQKSELGSHSSRDEMTQFSAAFPSSILSSTSSCDLCPAGQSTENCLIKLANAFGSMSDKKRLSFYFDSDVVPHALSICGRDSATELSDKECLAALDQTFQNMPVDQQQSGLLNNCFALSSYSQSEKGIKKTLASLSPARETTQLDTMSISGSAQKLPTKRQVKKDVTWTWGMAMQSMMIGFLGGAFVAAFVLIVSRTRMCKSFKTKILFGKYKAPLSPKYAYSSLDEEDDDIPVSRGGPIANLRESTPDDSPFAITL